MDVDTDRLIIEDEHMDYEEEAHIGEDEMMVEDGEELYEEEEEPMEAEPTPLISPFTNIISPSNTSPFIALPFVTPTALPGSATLGIVDLPEEDMTPLDDDRLEMFEGVEEEHPLIEGDETGEEHEKEIIGEGVEASIETFVEAETTVEIETGDKKEGEASLEEEEAGLAEETGLGEINNTEETHHEEAAQVDEMELPIKQNSRQVSPQAETTEQETISVNTNGEVKDINGETDNVIAANGQHSVDDEEYYDEVDEDHDHDQDEEEDEEDLPLTIDTLPPIILHLPKLGARTLFAPLPEDEQDMNLAVWLADRHVELGEAKLSGVWSAIRVQLEKEGLGVKGAEMVIVEKQTNLKMGEDDVNLQNITLLQLLQLHHSCELAEPVQLYIEFEADRFITRFNAIQREVNSQAEKRRESIAIALPDERDQLEEGEEEGVEEQEEDANDKAEEGNIEGDYTGEEDEKADEQIEQITQPEKGRKRAADEESVESESLDRGRRRRQDDYEQEREIPGAREDDDSECKNLLHVRCSTDR